MVLRFIIQVFCVIAIALSSFAGNVKAADSLVANQQAKIASLEDRLEKLEKKLDENILIQGKNNLTFRYSNTRYVSLFLTPAQNRVQTGL